MYPYVTSVSLTRIDPELDEHNNPDETPRFYCTVSIEGSQLAIRNLPNFEHQDENDFTERWETRTYDLDALVDVDVFISFWGPTLFGHTIVSWEFADGSHLEVSIETRKETGEEYSAQRGFFRQFELYYVVTDERGLIRLRTDHRGDITARAHSSGDDDDFSKAIREGLPPRPLGIPSDETAR